MSLFTGFTSQLPYVDAFLECAAPEGERHVFLLNKTVFHASIEGVPLRVSWTNGSEEVQVSSASGHAGIPERIKAGEERIIAGFGVRFESVRSGRRLLPDQGEPDPGQVRELERLDRYLQPDADRARALGRFYIERDATLQAVIFYEKSLFAANTNCSHFLAALAAFARLDQHEWVERILVLAASRHPRAPALRRWEEVYRAARQRYHHLTTLQYQSLLTRLDPEEIHQYHMPPFLLIFPASASEVLITFCRNTLSRARHQLRRFGDLPHEVRIHIDVWEGDQAQLAMGYYDGHAIHINHDYFRDGKHNEELQATLKHELVHVINSHTAQSLGLDLPRWLDEGIAYYMTEKRNRPAGALMEIPAMNTILSRPNHPHYRVACNHASARLAAALTATEEGETNLTCQRILRTMSSPHDLPVES